jgi:hypothetical protein
VIINIKDLDANVKRFLLDFHFLLMKNPPCPQRKRAGYRQAGFVTPGSLPACAAR